MATQKSAYFCNSCGESTNKWFGKCPNCGEWNTISEEPVLARVSSRRATPQIGHTNNLFSVISDSNDRFSTGISELDRVLGGGIVRGSAILIGGEPGTGKSTLLLQVCGNLSDREGQHVLYFSGEESLQQLKQRAERLGVSGKSISVANETDIETIIATIKRQKPVFAVVDSIQTMSFQGITSSKGSVTQIRECASMLLSVAKELGIAIFIVGHVNKDGAIAGPKVIEHIVDAVLYFEGDKYHAYRILRGTKNRFGSTNEVGMFDMTEKGLIGISNPSAVLLDGRGDDIPGSCVTCVIEGTRPILSEVQSLVSKTGFGQPRRTTAGFDFNRANLLIAVLEKRGGFFLSNLDVYINIVGGLQLNEPGGDLAVSASIVSAFLDKAIPANCFVFGEIGLGGEVRSVRNTGARLYEASCLGFKRCLIPAHNATKLESDYGLDIIPAKNISDIKRIFNT